MVMKAFLITLYLFMGKVEYCPVDSCTHNGHELFNLEWINE